MVNAERTVTHKINELESIIFKIYHKLKRTLVHQFVQIVQLSIFSLCLS